MKLSPVYGLLITIGLCYPMSCTSIPRYKSTYCVTLCNLTIHNQYNTYKEFKKKASVPAIRVIHFDLQVLSGGYSLNETNKYLYGWSKADVGEQIFSLPLEYISACFFLPFMFFDKLNITVKESSHGCFERLSHTCQQKIIFQTLIDFTRLNECDNKNCATLCRRKEYVNYNHSEQEEYSCCDVSNFNIDYIDIRTCLRQGNLLIFSQLKTDITVFSILAIIPVYIFIARRYVRWQGR